MYITTGREPRVPQRAKDNGVSGMPVLSLLKEWIKGDITGMVCHAA